MGKTTLARPKVRVTREDSQRTAKSKNELVECLLVSSVRKGGSSKTLWELT